MKRRRHARPFVNTDPWRGVIGEPIWRSGRGGLLGGDTTRRTRWWELDLECGHHVQRTVKYVPASKPRIGGTQHRSPLDVAPPPRRVRCECCATGSALGRP